MLSLRDRLRNRNTTMRIGLVLLIIANISSHFLRPTAFIGQGLIDGTIGFLFGVAIGALLLSLRPGGCRGSIEGRVPETPSVQR